MFNIDLIEELPDADTLLKNPQRYQVIYLDSQRGQFWRLVTQFYQNIVLRTVDFENYPYISCQIANVVSVALAKHIALQNENYFGPTSTDHIRNEESSSQLLVQFFSSYLIQNFFPKIPPSIAAGDLHITFAPKARQLFEV